MLNQKLLNSELRILESWNTYRGFMAARDHSAASEFLKARTINPSDGSAMEQVERTHTIFQNLLRTLTVILALMWLVGASFNVILLVEVFTDEMPWNLPPVFVSGVAVIWFWLPSLTIPKLVQYGIKSENYFWERYDSIISPDLEA